MLNRSYNFGLFGIVLSVFIFLLLSSVALAHRTGHDGGSQTQSVCRRNIDVVSDGTLPNGKRYVSIRYSLLGNDNARRRIDPFTNVLETDNGSLVTSGLAACTGTLVSDFFWDGVSINFNNSWYTDLFDNYETNYNGVANLYLGIPTGANGNVNAINSYQPWIGQNDNPPPGGYTYTRAYFGIDRDPNMNVFAQINDGGLAKIDGQLAWCLGMHEDFIGGYLGEDCATRADSGQVYPGGGDFAGFLNRDGNTINRVLEPRYRTSQFIKNGSSGSVDLAISSMNTNDSLPPASVSVCTHSAPGTGPCTYGTDPFVNTKAATIITYELNATSGTTNYTQTPDIHKVTADTSNSPIPGASVTVRSHISRAGGGPYPATYTHRFQWRLGTSGPVSTFQTYPNASGTGHRNATHIIPNTATDGQQYCYRAGVNSGRGQSTPSLIQDDYWSNSSWTCYTVDVPVGSAPVCTANAFTLEAGESAKPTFTLAHSGSEVTISNASYIITGPSGFSGSIPSTSLPKIPSGSNQSVIYPSPVSYDPGATSDIGPFINPGFYTIQWTMDWDDGTTNGTIASADCENVNGIKVASKPYARFYGGDVFAGGGVEVAGVCNSNGANAEGNIRIESGKTINDEDSIKGTGTELAVFATNVINGVQPLANQTVVDPITLAFANTDAADPSTFGGKYPGNSCNKEYGILPGSTVDSGGSITLSNGKIHATNTGLVTLNTDTGIANGASVYIYVNEDVYITGANFGFADTNWNNVTEIPSLYVVSGKNIYIDSGVTNIDAVLVAQNGAIFTCSTTTDNNLLDPSVESGEIASKCGSNLTVHGAFIADIVHLLRIKGTTSDGSVGEGPDSDKQAETFIFSPEQYIKLNPNIPTTSTSFPIESIISLPPTF